ncbi:hypothetical protein CUC43_33130 (plasmid) [Bacillus thuringiensis LM1212]|nr:hypothetical protein CUC43_33130 [Bacillus thuringiensis LM1212]
MRVQEVKLDGNKKRYLLLEEQGVSCPSPPKGTLRTGSIQENVSKSVCPTRLRDILVILFVKIDTTKLNFPQ